MSPPRARPRLKNSGLVWVEETDRQTDRRQLPGDVYEPLDPAVPEVLLPQTLHLPSRVHLLLNQLEAQLRTPALPRHERFLSNRGVCSDFIVYLVAQYTQSGGTKLQQREDARPEPTRRLAPSLGPRGQWGSPAADPSPGLPEGGMGLSEGQTRGGPRPGCVPGFYGPRVASNSQGGRH